MIRGLIFGLGHTIHKNPRFYNIYSITKYLEFASEEEIEKYQVIKLKKLLDYLYFNSEYYHQLMIDLKMNPNDIESIKDLERFPILTKNDIKNNYPSISSIKIGDAAIIRGSTGGSTGEPLNYIMPIDDEMFGLCSLYVNWSGYKPGDRIATIGGSQLIKDSKSDRQAKIVNFILNRRTYSSFDMSEEYMNYIVNDLNKFKPKFIRGYASSLYLLANHMMDNDLYFNFNIKGIFSTSEMLLPKYRKIIEKAFNGPIFDTYGLNDGGASAFECIEHSGLHISPARSIVEIVNDEGNQVPNGEIGRIVVTNLYNKYFPFIRYDTGDLGAFEKKPFKCACGRKTKKLTVIKGRQSDFITTTNGKKIHGEFFSHIIYDIENIKQFQVIQRKEGEINIILVADKNKEISKTSFDKIKYPIRIKDPNLKIQFEIAKQINTTATGKHKFVIREIA